MHNNWHSDKLTCIYCCKVNLLQELGHVFTVIMNNLSYTLPLLTKNRFGNLLYNFYLLSKRFYQQKVMIWIQKTLKW